MATIEEGQFDDAPDTLVTVENDIRGNASYIDTYEREQDEYLAEEDEDEYISEIEEEYDNNRVEDEDWENAERGACILVALTEV